MQPWKILLMPAFCQNSFYVLIIPQNISENSFVQKVRSLLQEFVSKPESEASYADHFGEFLLKTSAITMP